MQLIKPGDIVRFSDTVKEFCLDFNVSLRSYDQLMANTYLVLSVNELLQEVEVLTSEGDITVFGFHDLSKISDEDND